RADEFDAVFACTAPSPRGVPVAQVVAAAKELGCENVSAYDTVAEACRRALEYADGDDAVLVCGSLYTVGEARPVVQRHSN
ncbi:MAG: dihydrofolate synthase/folylpolyglutamate synthase, partial [Ilumatobacter sp.]